jgi:hypothetical protein
MSDIKKQLVYAVHMSKRTAKEKDRYFIVTDKKVEMGPSLFHGRGYWAEELPQSAAGCPVANVSVKAENLKDAWIPWGNIDHIENLTYKGR